MKRKLGITFLVCIIVYTGFVYLKLLPLEPNVSENSMETKKQEIPVDAENDDKKVAITFDDGPNARYTPFLLDGLKSRDVKATFFVIGENIVGNEALLKRMREEGHLIGNHSYYHSELYKLPVEEASMEIRQTNELIYGITGYEPEFLRPPFGAWDRQSECPENMIPVYWDIDPLDWKCQDATIVVQNVIEEVDDGDIILLHDIYKSSVEAALTIIDCLKDRGYEFVTVDALILD